MMAHLKPVVGKMPKLHITMTTAERPVTCKQGKEKQSQQD